MNDRITFDDPDLVSEINFSELEKKCFVDITEQIKRQPIALSKGTYSYKDYVNDIPLLSYGNFMCIVGASKSMKTFLKSALVAGYIGGQSNNYFSDLKGHNSKDKFVIDFDTEQGEFHAQKVFRRVAEMVGINPPNYKTYALRSLAPKERLQFVEWVHYESEYRNNIGLTSIDGIADLTEDVNNLEKSNEITTSLMKMTADTNSAMITILHKNFGTSKPTGHLGSSVLKKAETVIDIERERGADIVKALAGYTRNYPFEDFNYQLDENFLPYQSESF